MPPNTTTDSDATKEVTVIAPINIAVIKYWGKRDEDLVLPLNDSISFSVDNLYAKTRLRVGSSVDEDSVTINGRKYDLTKSKRFATCFAEIRRTARKRVIADDGDTEQNKACFDKIEVVSETNFPVEAGLASSAAGFAAIAYAFKHLYKLTDDQVIRIARLGSGSACRSLLGGFVHWKAGSRKDGQDSTCEVVAPVEAWSSLRAVMLVTCRDSKDVGSTLGMQRTVETSELLKHRVEQVVPKRVTRLLKAIKEKDFDEFASVMMAESNQLHAVCMDTIPPLKYMNENSWRLVRLVEALNDIQGKKRVAYTFDAGPNCCLLTESDFIPTILAALHKYCNLSTELLEKAITRNGTEEWEDLLHQVEQVQENVVLNKIPIVSGVIEDVYLSRIGGEPRLVLD